MNSVKAKFRCSNINNTNPSFEQVNFSAVYSNDPKNENYSWSKWTPSGDLSMSITNEALFGHFKLGKEYFLIIEEA